MQTEKQEMVVSGDAALKIADALNATTLKMLQILWQECLDVSTIGKRLGLSQAYISEQVRLLEELKLIKVSYDIDKRLNPFTIYSDNINNLCNNNRFCNRQCLGKVYFTYSIGQLRSNQSKKCIHLIPAT